MATKRKDPVLSGALDFARQAALQLAPASDIGDHVGVVVEADRLVTHRFACLKPGYVGWNWAVTLARVPRGRTATVCEVALVPGEGALLAPQWVPWKERLRPGDLARADVLPTAVDDTRLETVEVAAARAARESLGSQLPEELAAVAERPRVLSPLGRSLVAQRWYDSERGPSGRPRGTPNCGSCGFLLPLAGTVGSTFGVCGNEWAADDGRAVALDHGCGAHSQVEADDDGEDDWPITPPRVNELDLEVVELQAGE
ncbi:DUF3027 domain-containing protein [Buchananella hordeovulneris]|uniref:Uncharacterized protein n=1 Tax=Buchananella hordeovulneris TaxID=52770 RepID=A0A1Q5PVG0_9ACTO|nr:DUF3027 domain-containing protein [Buchananella hordeovulneris]MDO5081644.1 DUF3027 domain-containing protein [Buchananella hordeovulneris]OKL51449.1 hypothetical protein BSZ40_07755 [Buchananella hordeovulneris]RRD44287.1 DUF3027 domain-containing protein [Buchananella hordeovulneris]RRD53294.1 DUF3027 domain-containing protein [Buchananella hordeovulneris]